MKEIQISDFIKIEDKVSYIKWLLNNKNLEVIFSYKSDFSNAKTLRDIVFLICEQINLNWRIRNRIILVVDELNNNAIEYWSKQWDLNELQIIIKEEKEHVYLNIEVRDSWTWYNSKNASKMKIISKEKVSRWFNWYNSIRGRWLFMIIINLVDNLYFKDSENSWLIVWVEKKILKSDFIA